MNIFIKASLYLLDYNDNVLDVLFLSTDKDTPGQAYEINIKECRFWFNINVFIIFFPYLCTGTLPIMVAVAYR